METVCIFSSDDLGEVETIRNILETNGITTLVRNLYTQNIFGGLKPFTGHDAIAGSIQIFVRESDLERGLKLLSEDSIETIVQEENGHEPPQDQREVAEKEGDAEERKTKLLLYLANVLTGLSFLILPYLVNLPVLIALSKRRRTAFIMLLVLSTVLAATGAFFIWSTYR